MSKPSSTGSDDTQNTSRSRPGYSGGSAKLSGNVLTIRMVRADGRVDETDYEVQRLDGHPDIGFPAVRLIKADGSSFDLLRTKHSWQCECPDFANRRQHKGEECKHIRALAAVGLIQRDYL